MEKPAILGGDPTVRSTEREFEESQRWPQVGVDEIDGIRAVFADGNISTHPVIQALENAYSDRIGHQPID